jgi:hypothetical protein
MYKVPLNCLRLLGESGPSKGDNIETDLEEERERVCVKFIL